MGLINYKFVVKERYEYALYIVSEDIFSGDEDNNFLVGASNIFRPAIVSTYRFSLDKIQRTFDEISNNQKLKRFISNAESAGTDAAETMRIECIKTVAMHEMGHVLGLLPETETENIIPGIGGNHCNNNCVMRPGKDDIPKEWIIYSLDRIDSQPFCCRCLRLLGAFTTQIDFDKFDERN